MFLGDQLLFVKNFQSIEFAIFLKLGQVHMSERPTPKLFLNNEIFKGHFHLLTHFKLRNNLYLLVRVLPKLVLSNTWGGLLTFRSFIEKGRETILAVKLGSD